MGRVSICIFFMKAATARRLELRLALLEEEDGMAGTAGVTAMVEMGGDGGLEFVGALRGRTAVTEASAAVTAIKLAVASVNRMQRPGEDRGNEVPRVSAAVGAKRILWWRAAFRADGCAATTVRDVSGATL